MHMVLLIQEMLFLKSVTRQLGSVDKDVLGFPEQSYGNYKIRIQPISHEHPRTPGKASREGLCS